MSLEEKLRLDDSLEEAYKRNDLQSVERIVQNFPDPKYVHNMRIFHGIKYGDEKEVESLIGDASTDVNWINEAYFGWSFMHKAAANNKIKILDLMLRHGANINVQDDLMNRTPIFYCKSTQAIQLLLDNGAHLEHKDRYGNTPIHEAARWNYKDVVDILLLHGSNLDTRNNSGDTPLHDAVERNCKDVVDILLLHGSNLDTQNDEGRTPIHQAAICNNVDVLSKLISHGAALDTQDEDGMTALDLAKREESDNCIKILEEAMTKPQENTKLKVQKHLDEPDDKSTVTKKQEVSLPDDMKSEIIHHEKANTNKQDETIPELIQHIDEQKQKWEAHKEDMVLELQESPSHLQKERKRSEQLEPEKKELLSQIEREKKTSQEVLEKSKLMEKQKEALETEKNQVSSLLEKQRKRTEQLETEKKELLSQIKKEKKISQEVLEKNEVMKKLNQALETEKKESVEKQRNQSQQLETEKQDLVCQLEQERKTVQEMTALMKQNQTPEAESLSHLEKQRKQLEADKKVLLFQLEEEGKELQLVSVECNILKERNQKLETELNKQQKISVKSEMIEDQNHKLEDEKKTLQSQLEKHMQKLQELSDKCINAEAKTREVIIELEKGKKQLESEKNELLTALEEKQKEIQQLTDQKSGLARQLEEEKVELLSQLEEQTKKSKQLSVDNLCEVLEATAEVQRQWEELGIALGFDRTKLTEISQTHPSTLQRHYHLMRFWITDVGASWGALVLALKSEVLNEEELAKKIEIDHAGQLSNVRVKVLVTQNDKKLTEANLADLQAISLVEWKAVGLMLGIHNGILETIQRSHSSSEECQHAMLKCWINSGQAYWSTLVEALRSPLLGEDEIADEITKRHLKVQTVEQFNPSKPEGFEPGTFHVSTEKLEKMKMKIKQRCSDKPNAQGIAFLIGFPDGNDVQDLSSTFENDLSFTVWSKREITCAEIACLVKAAVKVQYPSTYKYIVFYYAGHVGVNKSNRPFLVPVQPEANNEAEILDIEENILSPFNTKKNRPSCLFFFDFCLSKTPAEMSKDSESDDSCDSMKPVAPQERILNLNAPVRCLVAYYATSVLQGEPIQRIWSQTLCKNLKEKYLSISRILDLTHDTIKDSGLTSPHYESFVGSVYLNGIPILPSEPVTSDSIVRRHRSDLCCLLNIKENETSLFSLAGGLLARGIIDTTSKDDVCHKHKEADTLLSHVEKAVNKNPDMLDVVLEVMEKESCLSNIVGRMKDESDTAGKRIRMKRPERYEVHKLLISKSADWVEIARELRVDDNYRKQLRKYLQESSEEDVLEKVLARWIESETCEVTWKCIINVLKELKYITLLNMVQKHLRKEDVIKKYSKTADFEFTALD